jgi:hypothetical protein
MPERQTQNRTCFYCGFLTIQSDELYKAERIMLRSIGLLEMESALGYTFESEQLMFLYFGTSYVFSSSTLSARLFVRVFTQIGCELIPISGASSDPYYIQRLKESLEPNIKMVPFAEILFKKETP